MTIVMILIAFGCGAFWGYAAGVEHCHREHDDDKRPRFKGPY